MLYASRLPTAIRIAALGLLGGMLCSWPLWDAGARPFRFPRLPLMGEPDFAPGTPAHWQAGLLATLVAALVLYPMQRGLLTTVIAGILLFCLLDVNCLQPWVWLYVLIFVVALFSPTSRPDRNPSLSPIAWLLAAVYAWGGIHKLTPYFAEDNFSWFCESFSFTRSFGQYPALGYSVAVLEMSFAAGLLWSRTRRFFRNLVIGFHIVILAALSPWGHDWNAVVLPWNLAMAALVWVAFPTGEDLQILKTGKPPLPTAFVIVLAWLAPALNIFGYWPHTLSWQLYTNTQPEGTFFADQQIHFKTRQGEDLWLEFTKGESTLLLDDWAMRDLRTPIFPSERVFRQMGKYLCGCLSQSDSAGIYILTVHRWNKSAEQVEKIHCRELLKQ